MSILRLDMRTMHEQGINRHPLTFLEDCGITYSEAIPVPIGDCWIIKDARGFIPIEHWKCFREIQPQGIDK